MSIKKVLYLLLAVAMFLSLAACELGTPEEIDDNDDSIYGKINEMVFFKGADGKSSICLADGTKVELDENIFDCQKSLNRTKSAFVCDYNEENGSATLYHVDQKGKTTKVSEGIYNYLLSDLGNGVIYVTEHNKEEKTAKLNLFDGKKSVVVAEDVYYDGVSMADTAISPNGKTVFYIKDATFKNLAEDEFASTGYVYTNGKSKELKKNILPIAIADDAKHIYYAEINNFVLTLGVRKGIDGEDTEFIQVDDSIRLFFFNKDYSQLVFCQMGKAYISIDGGAGEQIYDLEKGAIDIWEFIIPEAAQKRENGYSQTVVFGFDDFRGKIFANYDEQLFLFGDDYQSKPIELVYGDTVMTDDGESLFNIDSNIDSDNTLNKISVFGEIGNKELIAKNVNTYTLTSDGNIFFARAVDQGDFYRVNKNDDGYSEEEYISGNINWGNAISKSPDGTVYFVDWLNNLNIMNPQTGMLTQIENVLAVEYFGNNVFYYTDSGIEGYYNAYKSDGNGEFALFAESVSIVGNDKKWWDYESDPDVDYEMEKAKYGPQ